MGSFFQVIYWLDNWMNNRSVLHLSSALEGMNGILSVQRREKSSNTKSLVPCPKVVKLYNGSIGGIDLIDQRVLLHMIWIESHLLILPPHFL